MWDLRTNRCLQSFNEPGGHSAAAAIPGLRSRFGDACWDQTRDRLLAGATSLRGWAYALDPVLTKRSGRSMCGAHYCATFNQVVSAEVAEEAPLTVWSLENGAPVTNFAHGHAAAITSMASDTQDRRVITGASGAVRVCERP